MTNKIPIEYIVLRLSPLNMNLRKCQKCHSTTFSAISMKGIVYIDCYICKKNYASYPYYGSNPLSVLQPRDILKTIEI